MHTGQTSLWRLEELATECQRLAEALHLDEGDNRRVRWEPNSRLLRYYTTLGLLDRAERMVGRTAYYGTRHLLQLLAIKQLQKSGKSLNDIQQVLLGQSSDQLAKMLGLPEEWQLTLSAHPPLKEALDPGPARARFWEQVEQIAPAPRSKIKPPPLDLKTFLEIEIIPGIRIQVDPELFPDFGPERAAELRAALQAHLQSHKHGKDGGPT